MRRVSTLIALTVLAATAATALATSAAAQLQGQDLLPWPQALPPAEIPNEVQARPVEHCRTGSIACVAGLERRLERQWRQLDAACDHRAVIAYSYLQITRGLLADMRRAQPGLVTHRRWMAYLITNFSNRYFRAFAAGGSGCR